MSFKPVVSLLISTSLMLGTPMVAAAASGDDLIFAVYSNNYQQANRLLGQGVNLNAQDDNGYTALHWAAYNKNLPLVKLLLANGANPNAVDHDHLSPLFMAAAAGQVEIVQSLVAHGARPDLRAPDGHSAADYAKSAGHQGIVALLSQRVSVAEPTRAPAMKAGRPVQFSGGVIKNNGDVKATARSKFLASPWNPETIVEEVVAAYGLPSRPNAAPYIRTEYRGLGTEYVEVVSDEYLVVYEEWKSQVQPYIAKYIQRLGRKPVSFSANLQGEASLNLGDGTWYVAGGYEDGWVKAYWVAPCKVGPDADRVELGNDNAVGIFNRSEIEKPKESSSSSEYSEAAALRSAVLAEKVRLIQANNGVLWPSPELKSGSTPFGIAVALVTVVGGLTLGVLYLMSAVNGR